MAWGRLKLKDGNPWEEVFTTEHGTTMTEYKYDQNGNVLQISTYDDDEGTELHQSYEYLEYDGKGNWIKALIYLDGELKYISFREIEY